ncbi:MAG: hypothetical protein ACK4TL_09430 [Hyphomicrobiaceae bacterium]
MPMEAFIWPDADLPAERTEAATSPAQKGNALAAHAPPGEATTSPDEAAEPDDGWRRQFISALKDVDREPARPPPLPGTLPPLPDIHAPRRPPPRSLVPSRPAGVVEQKPLARLLRHRVGLSLLGLSAAAGLLSAVLPHATDGPEAAITAASAPRVLASTKKDPPPSGEGLAPVMFNTPVLVREGLAASRVAPPVLPVIETVRTVPVKLGRDPTERETAAPSAAAPEQPPAPAPIPQPTPAAAPPPLERDGLTALTAEPPAQQQAAVPPPPLAPRQEPEPHPARAEASAPRRAPQLSNARERAASKTTKQAKKRTAQSQTKSANRMRQAHWEVRRHGLRTPPPPEPSTLQKIAKWIWPWSKPQSTGHSPR